jgi:hypothetical protein
MVGSIRLQQSWRQNSQKELARRAGKKSGQKELAR